MNADSNTAQAAIWLAVAQLCSADEAQTGTKYSATFVHALSQVVCSQAEVMGADLESFAKHGKRAKISVDDVKLCARRNERLLQTISDEFDQARGA